MNLRSALKAQTSDLSIFILNFVVLACIVASQRPPSPTALPALCTVNGRCRLVAAVGAPGGPCFRNRGSAAEERSDPGLQGMM